MAANAPSGEDVRVWVGRVRPGAEHEHRQFLEWLNGPEAHEIFRRRRLTEYILSEGGDGTVTVVFKAPRTGDPRIMIDFLRYPGVWPEYWDFVSGGVAAPEQIEGTIKVHWRREA